MKCPYCGRKFDTLDEWRAHQNEWHTLTNRDALAQSVLEGTHGPHWYIGNASEADWRRAYEIVDALNLVAPLSEGDDE